MKKKYEADEKFSEAEAEVVCDGRVTLRFFRLCVGIELLSCVLYKWLRRAFIEKVVALRMEMAAENKSNQEI